jgi:hypothetical protein
LPLPPQSVAATTSGTQILVVTVPLVIRMVAISSGVVKPKAKGFKEIWHGFFRCDYVSSGERQNVMPAYKNASVNKKSKTYRLMCWSKLKQAGNNTIGCCFPADTAAINISYLVKSIILKFNMRQINDYKIDQIALLESSEIVMQLQPVINLTDDQFYELCQQPGLKNGAYSKGELIIMPPVGGEGSKGMLI